MTAGERQAFNNLKPNQNFQIKEVDKGRNVVLWPIDMYVQEAKRQLGNTRYYQSLPFDPTTYFKKKLDKLLLSARSYGAITKQELDFLTVDHPVVPTFYMLPKVHKDITRPPGRPMEAGGAYVKKPAFL